MQSVRIAHNSRMGSLTETSVPILRHGGFWFPARDGPERLGECTAICLSYPNGRWFRVLVEMSEKKTVAYRDRCTDVLLDTG